MHPRGRREQTKLEFHRDCQLRQRTAHADLTPLAGVACTVLLVDIEPALVHHTVSLAFINAHNRWLTV